MRHVMVLFDNETSANLFVAAWVAEPFSKGGGHKCTLKRNYSKFYGLN